MWTSLEWSDSKGRITRCRHSSMKYCPQGSPMQARKIHSQNLLYLSYTANIHPAITRDNCAARTLSCRLQLANFNPNFFPVTAPNYTLDLFTFTLIVSIIFRVDARGTPTSSRLIILRNVWSFTARGKVTFHVSVISTPAFVDSVGLAGVGRPLSSFSYYLINTRTRYCSHTRY